MSLDKDNFSLATEIWKTLERIFDVAVFVARRDDAGDSRPRLPAKRAQNHDIRQAKPPDQRHERQNSIDGVAEPQHFPGTVDGQPAADNLKAPYLDDVPKIDLRDESAWKVAFSNSQPVRETVERAQIGIVKDGDDPRRAR